MSTMVNILGLGWVGSALKRHLQGMLDTFAPVTVITWPAKAQEQIKDLPHFDHPVLALSSLRLDDEQKRYEEKLRKHFNRVIILRLGGLIGYDRHPGKFLAAKKDLTGAYHPINLIHRDDVVRILTCMCQKIPERELYNLVCDHHPGRKEFYQEASRRLNLEIPHFIEDYSITTPASNKLLKDEYHYTFIYSSPYDYLKVSSPN